MIDDNTQPDTYTLAWWRKQFKGVMHSLNRCNAEYADCWEAVKELRARCDSLEECLEAARAEIGRMNSEVEELKQAMGKVKAALQGLRKQVSATEPQSGS